MEGKTIININSTRLEIQTNGYEEELFELKSWIENFQAGKADICFRHLVDMTPPNSKTVVHFETFKAVGGYAFKLDGKLIPVKPPNHEFKELPNENGS